MKIYTRMYSEKYASIPKAHAPLIVTSGKKTSFAIPFPTEGILEGLVVSQVSTDVQVAAVVELLNSTIPFPPGDYGVSDAAAHKVEHYRILPTPLSVGSGTAGVMNEEDYGRGFRNIDGGFTLNQRYIYLVINPTSAGTATNWNVSISCRTDVG